MFADDVVVIAYGNSRKQIEERGQVALRIAENWCIKHKMKLSEKKTQMMLCRGKLSLDRPPIIKLAERSVVMVSEFKYLGLTFQHGVEGLKAGKHVAEISE